MRRSTARCGCEYEWGVHVALFVSKADLTPAQITSLRTVFERVRRPST